MVLQFENWKTGNSRKTASQKIAQSFLEGHATNKQVLERTKWKGELIGIEHFYLGHVLNNKNKTFL